MMWHTAEKQEASEELEVQPKSGLTVMTARRRFEEYGENIRVSRRQPSGLWVLLVKLLAPVNLLLMLAAGLSVWTNIEVLLYTGPFDWPWLRRMLFSVTALAATLTLTFVRTRREIAADRTIVAIKHTSSPNARVLRGGRGQEVPAESLVPGDIVLLEVGDIIPADGRLLRTQSFMCDESALTGDDTPALKDADVTLRADTPLEQRVNMAYSGTVAVTGRATLLVTETGARTEMARRRAKLTRKVTSRTPLVRDAFRTRAFFAWMLLCMLLTAAAWSAMHWQGILPLSDICRNVLYNAVYPADYLTGGASVPQRKAFDAFVFLLTLLVCLLPLGLPQNVMHALSKSIRTLRREGAMPHRFRKAELIGCTSVICADKTGTLTTGEMSVAKAWPVGDRVACVDEGFWSAELRYLMDSTVMCCDSKPVYDPSGQESVTGDKTDAAIVRAYIRNGCDYDGLTEAYRKIGMLPFDSARKRMSMVYDADGMPLVLTKGAPDTVLACCADADADEISRRTEELCAEGLRVIAVAVRVPEQLPEELSPEVLETDMTFIGLIGLADPLREGVLEAADTCAAAGIRPIMMTGDQPGTAAALARRLHILHGSDGVLTGEALAALSDRELRDRIDRYAVFARISSEDKVRIIRTWRERGECVLVSAGGMNDGPALHAADISCSVEATATDVAVDAADMTLSGDHFSNILSVVRTGRRIRRNLTAMTEYTAACAAAQTLTLLVGAALFRANPLHLLPLLLLNVLLFVAVQPAFADEPCDGDEMKSMPDRATDRLLGRFEKCRALLAGIQIAFQTLLAYAVGGGWRGLHPAGNPAHAATMAFGALGFGLVLHALCTRSEKPPLLSVFWRNRLMLLAAALTCGLAACLMTVPYVREIMGFVPLSGREWAELGILLAVQLAVWQFPKLYARVKF